MTPEHDDAQDLTEVARELGRDADAFDPGTSEHGAESDIVAAGVGRRPPRRWRRGARRSGAAAAPEREAVHGVRRAAARTGRGGGTGCRDGL